MQAMFPESTGLRGAEQIGEGGAGLVYRAEHPRFGPVAVKVAIDNDPATRHLLHSEYRLLRSLSHTGIIKLFDLGQTTDQRPFIVMELLSGGDFYAYADRLPISQRFRALGEVISALEYMHALGIVHRDLKGENILLDDKQRARLTDLGLATNDCDCRTRAGTLEYMAPEIINNQEATAAADIYSLGVILFRVSAGRLPFDGSDPLQAISLKQNPDEIDGEIIASVVSDRFASLVRRCLDSNPALRPKSVSEIAEQLILADVMTAKDICGQSVTGSLHHQLYSFNISFAKQELRRLPADFLIRDQHQGVTAGLPVAIADHLKLEGYWVASGESNSLEYGGEDGTSHRIELGSAKTSTAVAKTIEYPELDRFGFDSILSRILPSGIDPLISDRLYEYTAGNIGLLWILLTELEHRSLLDARSGRILLQRERLFEYEPEKAYYRAVGSILPQIPPQLIAVAEFLSADPFGVPRGALITTPYVDKDSLPALAELGVVNHDDYQFARSYYREYFHHGLTSSQRDKIHQVWAELIDKGLITEEPSRSQQAYYHLVETSNVDRAVESGLELAQRCRQEQKPDKARLLLARLAALPCSAVAVELQLRLRMLSGNVYKDAGDTSRALSEYACAVRLAKRLADRGMLAEAYKFLGDVYKYKADYRRGQQVLRRAEELYRELGDELELSHCYNNIGNIYWLIGDLKKAAGSYESALEIQKRLGAKKDIASSLSNLGTIKYMLHEVAEGICLCKESMSIKREIGDKAELARTANNLACMNLDMDELQAVVEYLNESLQINQSLGAERELLYNYWNFSEAESRRGNYQKSAEWIYRGLRLCKQSDFSMRGTFATLLSELQLAIGKYGKAGHSLRVASGFEARIDDQSLRLKLLEVTGNYYRLLCDSQRAGHYITEGLQLAENVGEPTSIVRLLIARARTESAAGSTSEVVLNTLAEAEKRVKKLTVRREPLVILLDRVEFLIQNDRLDEAQEIFSETNSLPQFEGINTLQSRISYLHGMIEQRFNRHKSAVTLFNDACLAAKTMQMPEQSWRALTALGTTYQTLTEYERASKCFMEAFAVLKGVAAGITNPALRRSYLRDPAKIRVAEKLEEMSSLVG